MVQDPWLRTAYSYLYIRNFDKALDSFRRAMDSDPTNPEYRFHASITAFRSGLTDLARQWGQEAVDLDPESELYRQHLGVVQSKQWVTEGVAAETRGELEVAIDAYGEAVQADPFNQEAHELLQSALYQRFEQANEHDSDTHGKGEYDV